MANGPISTRTGSMAGRGSANSISPCVAGVWRGQDAEAAPSSLHRARDRTGPLSSRARGRTMLEHAEGVSAMTQTTGRIFDEFAKLMTDAAGMAQGVRREVDGVVRSQAERVLR